MSNPISNQKSAICNFRGNMTLTGAQILWEALVREGVTDVFGYPGGAILPAYDAMLGYPIRHILVRHEQGATHMADGYGRASGRVGVAVATSGPGATNMVTGIATAMMDSSPIVCITGQVGSRLIGSDAFQETDITGITLPITKHNYLVTSAADVAASVREAFAVARSGRPGPVLVDITKDAQQGSCDFDWDAAEPHLTEARDDALPGDGDDREATALINAAERPLILAGHGGMPSGAAANRAAGLSHIAALKGDSAVRDIQNLPDDGHLYAAHVINDLWRLTGGNALVVTDVGQHQMWEAQYYKHETSRSLITSGGLGTMGFALPAAIGAKIARPDAEVWAVIGDGGFQMTMAELATAMQERLDINVAVINNGYLGMVRQWQEFFYERRYAATPLLNPDFVKLAEAFGLCATRVTKRGEVG